MTSDLRAAGPEICVVSTPQAPWKPAPARQILPRPHERWIPGPEPDGPPIEGFGACFNELGWQAVSNLSEEARDELMRGLFGDDGCAFTLCRMPIGANDFSLSWYSHNDHPGDLRMERFSMDRHRFALFPFIRAAQKIRPDLRLWASPWCPPSWMKESGIYASASVNNNWGQKYGHECADLAARSRLIDRPEILDSYALYFVKFIQACQAEGIPISAIHPQNELFAAQIFPSCPWPAELLARFITRHLAPALRRAGLDTEIWLGTINAAEADYVREVLEFPGIAGLLSGVGLQWEGRRLLRSLRLPEGMRIMQTEAECHNGSNDWAGALETFESIVEYLSHGAVAFMHWNMALGEWGMSSWGWRQNSLATVEKPGGGARLNPEYHIMRHFSQFLPPGSRKLPVERMIPVPARSEIHGVLFKRPDGAIVGIFGNTGSDEEARVGIDLPWGACTLVIPPLAVCTCVWEP